MRHVFVLLLAAAGAIATAAEAWDPPEEAVLAEIPFAAGHTSGVWIDLAPADVDRPMVLQLDTGASASVLTPALAGALGVRVRRLKSTPYRRPTRLGRDLQFWIDTRWSDTASSAGMEFGLLGGTFLSSYVIEIDYGARRVRFLDKRKGRVPESVDAAGEQVLPLKIVGNRPYLDVDVAGETSLALLDTGASLPMVIEAAVADALGIESHEAPGFEVYGTVTRIDATIAFAGVGLGGDVFPETPLLVAESTFNQGATSGVILGAPILARYVVRIDYPKRRLWLRRLAEPAAQELEVEHHMREAVSRPPAEAAPPLRYPSPDARDPQDPVGPSGL
jgi:predicted aspartyl protease